MAVQKPKKAKPKKPRFFRHFDTTIPVIRPCSTCGCWLAAGISEGLHTSIDLIPLDVEQQLRAVLTKTQLYAITRTGLVELDHYRLTDPKFGERYPRHRCGTGWQNKTPRSPIDFGPHSDTPPY